MATSIDFARAARALGQATRRLGLEPPAFRTPPRLRDTVRSIRWAPGGRATVSVVIHGRAWPAVLADLVDGVVVANQLVGAEAIRVRTALWEALEGAEALAA